MKRFIIANMATCNQCGTWLHSTHRHDFKKCKCISNPLIVDGGNDYIRCSVNGDEKFN